MPSNVRWTGNAGAVSQVDTIKVTADSAATVYSVTINNKTVSVQGTGTGVNDTAAALQAALAASPYGEFSEITWTVATDTVTATGPSDGAIFIAVAGVSGGAGTVTQTTVTAGTGPYDWDNESNWDTGALPISGDSVFFDNLPQGTGPKYNIDKHTVVLALLSVAKSFAGQIGLPKQNGSYTEYRDDYLKIGATVVRIGQGNGNGSGLIKINTGTDQTAIEVADSGFSADGIIPAVLWIGTHASNTVEVLGGSFGAAVHGGEVATILTGRYSGGTVVLGQGVTQTNVTNNGANCTFNSAITNYTGYGDSAATLYGTGGVGTLQVRGGTFIYRASTGGTTAQIGGFGKPAVLDCSQDLSARTFTDCSIGSGGTVKDPCATLTVTNGFSRMTGFNSISCD